MNGTVTAGDFTVTGNTFIGGTIGINFWSGVYDIEDTQVTVGNTVVSNNTFVDQSDYGIYFDYWDMYDFYGSTIAVFGDFTISGNTVTATNYAAYPNTDGIYINDIDYIEDIYDESSVTTGSITVTNNTVNVDDYALVLESEGIYEIGDQYWGDTVSIVTGPKNIINNTFNSNGSSGVFIDIEETGHDMYGFSQLTYGGINFINNTVTAEYNALYYYLYRAGYYLYENSTFSMGASTFSDNSLISMNDMGLLFDMESCGSYLEQNAMATFGPTDMNTNIMTGVNDHGLYFSFYDIANEMIDYTTVTVNPFTVDNNMITATNSDGMYVDFDGDANTGDMEDNAHGILPDWIITDNLFDVTGGYEGLEFYIYETPEDNYGSTVAQFGKIFIEGNTFNPDKNAGMHSGISLYFEDIGDDTYGPAVSIFDDITIMNNYLYSMDSVGIKLVYDNVGSSFTGAPVLTMGDVDISINTIDTAPAGIEVNFSDLYTEDAAAVTIGELNIHDNILSNITDTGIYAFYYSYNNDPVSASLTIGAPNIAGNTITGSSATGDGIVMEVVNDTDGITMGMTSITGNSISGFDSAIYLEDIEEASLSCNYLEDNTQYGIRFDTDGTNFPVNTNSLVNNNIGLSIGDGSHAVVDAKNNWWGDKLGPAACASCNGVNPGTTGTIDYTPWLSYQPQKSRCGLPFPWVMFAPATTGMGPQP